jgi:hypothetical protein
MPAAGFKFAVRWRACTPLDKRRAIAYLRSIRWIEIMACDRLVRFRGAAVLSRTTLHMFE